jgi:hypothetical protein
MNIFSDYIAYLKDNPEGYWFKRKPFGWGWTPARWQGWATIIVFIALIVWNAHRINVASQLASGTLRPFVLQTLVLFGILILICYKTGEAPKWQWGWSKKGE